MARKPPVKTLIQRYARKYGVDPRAAIAVAMGEGGLRWGAVGDQGQSHGPYQLKVGGANPYTGAKAAAFANSAAGIEYAIRKMSESGARGLKGQAAVNAIVRNFERPADPDTSVARAIGRLGSPIAGARASTLRNVTPVLPDAPQIPQQAVGTLNDIFKKVGLPSLDIVGDIPLPQPPSVPGRSLPPTTGAAPAQLPQPVKGGPKMPRVNLMLTAIRQAQAMGLSVRENEFVDHVDPVHVKGSDHYKVIGKRQGKKINAGVDVSGDPAKMAAFFKWAEQFSGRGLNDLFYDPIGYSYDRGKRWNKTIGDHDDHVHFSV